MEYFASVKKNEILLNATIDLGTKIIMLSKRSETWKNTYSIFPLICISKPVKYGNSEGEEDSNDPGGVQGGGGGGLSEVLVIFYGLTLLKVTWVLDLPEVYFMICVLFSMCISI